MIILDQQFSIVCHLFLNEVVIMDYFEDIYLKRLNRFGLDYHSRVQNKRELDFELYLLKSVYKVDFLYKG